jgi:hypothetical protein
MATFNCSLWLSPTPTLTPTCTHGTGTVFSFTHLHLAASVIVPVNLPSVGKYVAVFPSDSSPSRMSRWIQSILRP